MDAASRITVLGLGNVLMRDDALGPTVVARLVAGYEFPPGVSVHDAGTPGLDLVPFLAGAEHLIVVDTVRASGGPGEIRLYRTEQILNMPTGPRLSPHDPGLKETLLTLQLQGLAPREVLLVGVIPEQVALGPGVGPVVRAAASKAEAEVLRELDRLGLPARARSRPKAPDLWWEAPVPCASGS
jgi:hydrogenase maturation protease